MGPGGLQCPEEEQYTITNSNRIKFAAIWRRDTWGSQKEAATCLETIAIIQAGYQHGISREGKNKSYAKYIFKAETTNLMMKQMCGLREREK